MMRFLTGRLSKAAFMAASAFGLLLLHMWLLASSMPVQRSITLHVSGWPANTPPMRIALLSDLHVSAPSDTPEKLTRVVEHLNALQLDLVLIAGDFLSTYSIKTRHYGPVASIAPLGGLHARLGTVAVLGNHDMDDVGTLSQLLSRAGVTLLRNETVRRGPLAIIGIESVEMQDRDKVRRIAAVSRPNGGIPLAMMHIPDPLAFLPPFVHLAVASHTHCGQISPPIIGPLITGTRSGRRFICGPVWEGDRLSITSGGLGTSELPLRLGASPDYWIITLGR